MHFMKPRCSSCSGFVIGTLTSRPAILLPTPTGSGSRRLTKGYLDRLCFKLGLAESRSRHSDPFRLHPLLSREQSSPSALRRMHRKHPVAPGKKLISFSFLYRNGASFEEFAHLFGLGKLASNVTFVDDLHFVAELFQGLLLLLVLLPDCRRRYIVHLRVFVVSAFVLMLVARC